MNAKLLPRMFAFSLACFLLLGILPVFGFSTPTAAAETKVVSFTSPAIPATVGETVTLTDYAVMISSTQKAPATAIRWSSDEIPLKSGNTVTPTARGVYPLTATYNNIEKTVYLVVKGKDETEFVLYENDYEDVSSFADLEYDVIQQSNVNNCKIDVKDGKLVLSAQSNGDYYIRTLLPAWLGDFADYKIESVAAMTAAQGATRWMGFMFRVQNSSYPYYQIAARNNATASNGTEIALRTVQDKWEVQYAGPFSSALSDHAYHTFTAEVFEKSIRYTIDGNPVLSTSAATLSDPGRIGLQVRGCELSLDSIRITLQSEAPKSSFAAVEDPSSNLVLAPSVVAEINTENALTTLKTALNATKATLPATAVFSVDKNLNVTVGSVKQSIEDTVKLLDRRVIPAFRLTDPSAANALATYLKEHSILDVFVISESADALKTVRATHPIARAILDFSGKYNQTDRNLPISDLHAIRSATNACGARICLLPEYLITRENVLYLQKQLMTVWVTSESTVKGHVSAIVSGANGIVTPDYAALSGCYTRYFEKNSVTRVPEIIGHRGVPSLAPENTVEGSLLANEKGAALIEMDIYLTTDNVIAVMHDGTLDRTTNGTGNVESYSYEQLRAVLVDGANGFDAVPVPCLADYFKAFKGLDAHLIVEIKSGKTAICQKLVDLVEEYDIADQVSVIAFGTAIQTEMKRVAPELSLGHLTSTPVRAGSDVATATESLLRIVQSYDATYNPNFTNLDAALIKAAAHRGVTFWPWTANNLADIDKLFFAGSHAITTNYTQYFSDCVHHVATEKSTYTVAPNGTIDLTAVATTYANEAKVRNNGTLIFLEGDDIFTYDRGVLTANASEGTATVMLSIPCSSPNSNIYYLSTMPFTVTVGDVSAEESTTAEEETTGGDPIGSEVTTTENEVTTEAPTTDPATPSGGCGAVIAFPAILMTTAVLCGTSVLLRKKR